MCPLWERAEDISTPYADLSKINEIKALMSNPKISATLAKLGDDCEVKITINMSNSACIDIVLSQSNKLSNGITVTQSIELIFKPTPPTETVYSTVSSFDWESAAMGAVFAGVVLIAIVGVIATGPSGAVVAVVL